MSSYTPGPWAACEWRVYAEPNGRIEVICDTANNKATRTDENQANANLIAAAPELLEACEAAEKMLGNNPNHLVIDLRGKDRSEINDVHAMIVNALAKARM